MKQRTDTYRVVTTQRDPKTRNEVVVAVWPEAPVYAPVTRERAVGYLDGVLRTCTAAGPSMFSDRFLPHGPGRMKVVHENDLDLSTWAWTGVREAMQDSGQIGAVR